MADDPSPNTRRWKTGAIDKGIVHVDARTKPASFDMPPGILSMKPIDPDPNRAGPMPADSGRPGTTFDAGATGISKNVLAKLPMQADGVAQRVKSFVSRK
jgi:hypothetical protein